MTKTTIELLREAREWLSLKEHWCARQFANEKGGLCAIGALAKFGLGMPETQTGSIQRLGAAARLLDSTIPAEFGNGPSIVYINDFSGWARTLEMFDLAIKLEQEEMDRQAKELVESSVSEAAEIGR